MKKFLIIFILMLVGMQANAEYFETNVNMANFWQKNGKDVQKVEEVAARIINANKLDKHIPVEVVRNNKIPNAQASFYTKKVYVYTGLLPYINNDDELAYILSHEMVHCLDFYDGILKALTAMKFNSKSYEIKADLAGIDLMVKAGYNPIAAICIQKRFLGETYWDIGLGITHPKASKRMFESYKHIYNNYPWALKSDMVKDINYQNFTYVAEKEINNFHHKQKQREARRKIEDL